jgi:OmpA-OmpF porin, OOP family
MTKVARAMMAVVCVLGIAASAGAQQKDSRNCQDHPLFTRMPTSWIYSCSEKPFDSYAFPVGAKQTQAIEGRFWQITYYPQATATQKPSELQILRNFENAIAKIGGKSIYATKGRETFTITKDGREIWVDLWAEFTGKYGFRIVEKGGMEQEIQANADSFGNDLKATGHVAVYGILFDTGKATIKPESAQAIGEVAKLLTKDPALKVYVVGHTDTVGVLEPNMKLSQERAEAVVQALVQTHKIAAARLKAFGAGPYAPVASNDAEDGRAKNRRVELVKR